MSVARQQYEEKSLPLGVMKVIQVFTARSLAVLASKSGCGYRGNNTNAEVSEKCLSVIWFVSRRKKDEEVDEA